MSILRTNPFSLIVALIGNVSGFIVIPHEGDTYVFAQNYNFTQGMHEIILLDFTRIFIISQICPTFKGFWQAS